MHKCLQRQCRSRVTFSLLAIGLIALTACASGTFGTLQRSQEAFENFTGYKVLPGHRYYTTGVPMNPDAIIAISDRYTLVTNLWQEQEMSPKLLGQLLNRMHNEVGVANAIGLIGSTILDDGGKRIGEWYSFINLTTVEMLGENKVSVHPPDKVLLEQARPRERGRG